MKIDNMREEHQEKPTKDAPEACQEQEEQEKKDAKPLRRLPKSARNTASSAFPLERTFALFKELNVDWIIEGGQTMNPSTEGHAERHRRSKRRHHLHFPEQ